MNILERYPVPRDRAVIDTPGWGGWAGGGEARRFWLHPRVLVGGSILHAQDGEHLRRAYGITHVLSFESERIDHGKGWPAERLCWCPFVDVGADIHPHLVRQALAFARAALADPQAVLYAHCQMGGGRGPSAGYLACVGALGEDRAAVLARLAALAGDGVHPHPRYIASIDEVLMDWRVGGAHVEYYPSREGDMARRYWVDDRVLVGGTVRDAADGARLRALGVTHILSAEHEHTDEGRGYDGPGERCYVPFPDDGQDPRQARNGVPAPDLGAAVDFARAVMATPGNVLYCHCRLGVSRGPSMGYLALRATGYTREAAMARVRNTRGDWQPHATYIAGIEAALAAKGVA